MPRKLTPGGTRSQMDRKLPTSIQVKETSKASRDVDTLLGERVRHRRKAQHLSLREVAD